MKRYLFDIIAKDLGKKMVFIAGPRQVGKTTLGKEFLDPDLAGYLSWDVASGRESILKQSFPAKQIVMFDEIHKFRSWKSYMKGVFDDPKRSFKILVTGSAKLDLFQKGGDSLQGRYHLLRLHPFSVSELGIKSNAGLQELLDRGGFPEPYFSGSVDEARRWAREYRVRLIQEEVRTLEQIEDLGKLELLAMRLPELVGSPLSINGLREDLQVAHKTIERWLAALERLYAVFRIAPLASSKIKALRKSQKYYLYNWSVVEKQGPRFENLVAGHLLKWVHYQQDVFGRDLELSYVRDSTGREVDFALSENGKVATLIECKKSDTEIDSSLKYFAKRFPEAEAIQLVQDLEPDAERVSGGIRLVPALSVLEKLV